MKYSKVEIVDILRECKAEDEVFEACSRFRYLIQEGYQDQLYFITYVANERLKETF